MSFQKDNTYSMHYKNVHPPPGKEKFKCLHPGCSYESYNKGAVDNHTHPTCPFCNKNLKTISGLFTHISKVCYKEQKGANETHFKFGKRIYDDYIKKLINELLEESESDSDSDCEIYPRERQQQSAGHSTQEQ